MSLGLTRVLQIDDREVVVRELTVAELRQWIAYERVTAGAAEDLVDSGLLKVPLSLLSAMTRLSLDELRALPPSVLERIEAAGEEVNPRFFGWLGRLQAASGSALPSSTGA